MIQCYNSAGTRERILELRKEYEILIKLTKEIGFNIYSERLKDIQNKLKELGE